MINNFVIYDISLKEFQQVGKSETKGDRGEPASRLILEQIKSAIFLEVCFSKCSEIETVKVSLPPLSNLLQNQLYFSQESYD
jgi:hypothetical protein